MAQEIGESREKWANDIVQLVEDFANKMKSEYQPFYIVYACKPDRSTPNLFRQTIKAYYKRPPLMIGILVWYVNNQQGIFEFVPDLSSPPDVPLAEALLSHRSEDVSDRVAMQGKNLNVLLS